MLFTKNSQSLFFLAFPLYLIALVVLIIVRPIDFYKTPDQKWAVQSVEFASSEPFIDGFPAPENLKFSATNLPHDWKGENLALEGVYRAKWTSDELTLDRNVSGNENQYAVYIPRVMQNAAIFINQQWIGQGGSFNPTAHGWNQPLYFEFDAATLSSSANEIVIYVSGYVADDNLLSQVYIGPQTIIKPSFDRQNLIHVGAVEWTSSLTAFLAIFMTVLWLKRSKDSVYGWLALACASLWVLSFNFTVSDIPFGYENWQSTMFAAQGWTIVFLVMSCYRVLNKPSKLVEYGMFSMAMGGAVLLFVFSYAFADYLYVYLYTVWNMACLALGAYSFGRMLYGTINSRRFNHLSILLVPTSFTVACAIRDNLILLGIFDRSLPLFNFYGFFSILATHSILLVLRVVKAFDESEQLNRELEQRVSDKEAELKENYALLAKLEKDEAIDGERDRIMRDMHDGVGGQLVGALNLLNTPGANFNSIKSRLRESITDLRLMIDSLDPSLSDWDEFLSVIEIRFERQLSPVGISLIWDNQGGHKPTLLPNEVLQIMRIMQEALNNIIKHSGAESVDVTVISSPDGLKISIADDGQTGETPIARQDGSTKGRGLDNMRHRARLISGEIEFTFSNDSTENGSTVTLRVPSKDN